MSELLETLVEESNQLIEKSKNLVLRNYHFPSAENMIKVVIGMRRTGKSYFLLQTIHNLLASGIDLTQILLLNFEDDRLLPMNAKQMGGLVDSFYSLYPENHQRQCFLFFDEIQNVDDWQLVVRRYFDSKNVQLFLTGSSAKLLSKEISSNLRGRALSLEILPYSFKEYLAAHAKGFPQKPLGKMAIDNTRKSLLDYFSYGGFPAVQGLPKNEWREALQGYIDTVILRDIVERYSVTNISLLKWLIITLLKNAASPFALNKFVNDIKSQGYKVSKETIHTYFSYLQDAFLIFAVPFYTGSERIKQTRPKKIYANDSGLINICLLESNNYGKLFENLVYLDLRRQGNDVFYYNTKSGYEIDFVVFDGEGQGELLQVCWDSHDEKTQQRELRALNEAKRELGFEGRIISLRDYLVDFVD